MTTFPYGLAAFVLPLLVGSGLIGLAVWVFRSGRIHRHNVLFASLFLLSGLKSVSEALSGGLGSLPTVADQFHDSSPFFPTGYQWYYASVVCAMLYVPLLLVFILSFPKPTAWMVKRPWLAWIPVGLGLVLASALVAVYETLRTGAGQVSAAAVDFFVFAVNAFNLVGTAATVFVVVRLLLVRLRGTEPAERKQAGIMLVGFLPAFVMGWAISLLQLAEGDRPGSLTQSLLLFYSPILELAAAAIVAYAILRYRFLGVDQTARLSLRSVVIALALVLIFVATQVFTNVVLQGGVFAFAGPYGSFLITGAVSLVALRPVDKLGQRLSSRLVPQEAKEDRAASIYRAQVTHVLRDGNVTDREWAFLRSLRDQLGIAGQAARRIEEEVERALKVDDPRTGQPGPTA